MAGVGGLSSLGLFLLLLLASSSAAREERSPRVDGWQPVKDLKDSNYLALLKVDGVAKCSGSILSKWTILTFCEDVTEASETKAYAGLLAVKDATEDPSGEIQVRTVKTVAEKSDVPGLKICILNEKWTDKVGIVKFPSNNQREELEGCNVLGFRKPKTITTDNSEIAHVMTVATIGATQCGLTAPDGLLYSSVADKDAKNEKLNELTVGGPAVCDGFQRAINKEFKDKASAGATATSDCNFYINIAKYRDWIDGQIQEADAAGESGGTGGAGGNGTSPSSGYSIHSHLNKYSNWKVLGFITSAIVIFLQY